MCFSYIELRTLDKVRKPTDSQQSLCVHVMAKLLTDLTFQPECRMHLELYLILSVNVSSPFLVGKPVYYVQQRDRIYFLHKEKLTLILIRLP
jgi:hypothetical protein